VRTGNRNKMSRFVGVVKELWAKHENLVKRHPLFFNSVYYGNMYCISDLSQQLVVTPLARGEPRQKLKPDEAFRCWIMGAFFFGPVVTTFVRTANRLFPGTTLKAAAKKVALDQCVMAVPMISMFYFGMNMLEGNSFQTFQEEWKAKFFPSWRTAVCFWPAAQMISWTKIPEAYRPRYLACCSFVWTNFLCYMKNRPVEEMSRFNAAREEGRQAMLSLEATTARNEEKRR